MKSVSIQAKNEVNIVGTLMDVVTGAGKTSDGRNYERATATIQVTQTYGGKTETSEIPVEFFATEFTSKGAPNPALRNIQELKLMNSAQNVGFNAASRVRLNGTSLVENAYVGRNGQLVDNWRIRGSFINKANQQADVAVFVTDIFILSINEEVDAEGETTGRLLIKGGIVQYNGRLDVVDFIAEGPDQVQYISRNWEPNTTVTIRGRIRMTSQEKEEEVHSGGWGEDIPEMTTRLVRELIIITGDDEAKEDDLAYDPTEIKKAAIARKARIEQMQSDVRKYSGGKPATEGVTATAKAASDYSWV